MKKILAVLLMLPVITLSSETEEKYVVRKVDSFCFSSKSLNNMIESAGERPILSMISIRNNKPIPSVLFVNADTKTWTLVEKINDEFCVTSFGGNFEVLMNRDKMTI